MADGSRKKIRLGEILRQIKEGKIGRKRDGAKNDTEIQKMEEENSLAEDCNEV